MNIHVAAYRNRRMSRASPPPNSRRRVWTSSSSKPAPTPGPRPASGRTCGFSTWGEVVDPAAEKLLAPTGWVRPDPATYPTGGDWAALYLQPLADTLGKPTAVIGSGASAFSALAHLARADDGTGTHATWILRRGISGSALGGEADQLPARGALCLAAKAAVDGGYADAVTGPSASARSPAGASSTTPSPSSTRPSPPTPVGAPV